MPAVSFDLEEKYIIMNIFSYIGYFFGYIQWAFFELTNNYGVALILFTLLVKVLLFPMFVKQQISVSNNARLSQKQKEIQQRYANDKQRQNIEVAKLYEQEGVNPASGCLTMLLPLVILFGVLGAVYNPLVCTLHIPANKVNEAVSLLGTIPGVGTAFSSRYGEIEIIKLFPAIRDQLTMFTAAEIENIAQFNAGFNFLGLDLLATPKYSSFGSMMWIIPALCLVTSVLTTYMTQKKQPNQAMGQGCMKYSTYLLSLFTAWIAYTVPAAVGLYWLTGNVLQVFQTMVMNKYYSHEALNAKREARRIARRELEEKDM